MMHCFHGRENSNLKFALHSLIKNSVVLKRIGDTMTPTRIIERHHVTIFTKRQKFSIQLNMYMISWETFCILAARRLDRWVQRNCDSI